MCNLYRRSSIDSRKVGKERHYNDIVPFSLKFGTWVNAHEPTNQNIQPSKVNSTIAFAFCAMFLIVCFFVY